MILGGSEGLNISYPDVVEASLNQVIKVICRKLCSSTQKSLKNTFYFCSFMPSTSKANRYDILVNNYNIVFEDFLYY